MKILILTVLFNVAWSAVENIVVDSGQSLTITCVYRNIYVDINKEVVENNQKHNKLMYLRVNDNPPEHINSESTGPWKFNSSSSYYGSNATENKLSITLATVELGDEGTYLCKDVMKQVTKEFRVTVVVKPKSTVTFNSNMSIKDASDVLNIGKCESLGAKPAVKIDWEDASGKRVDTVEVKSAFRGKVKDTVSQLIIRDIDRTQHHQQKYRCVVYQNDTVVFTSAFSPNVNVEWQPERPAIVHEPRLTDNATAFDAGSEMKLSCMADGNPKPQFEWSVRDDQANRTLQDLTHWTTDNINLNSATLTTTSLLASDSTITFICTARNVHGVQTNQLKLDIKELPTANAGPMGLLWALLGVIAVVLAVAVCMLINRWIQRRRSGIYKTEANHRDGSCDSLNDELQAAAKKEYFM